MGLVRGDKVLLNIGLLANLRLEIELCSKCLEQNQSMYHDWVTFWHLFGGPSKIKSKNGKNKKYF